MKSEAERLAVRVARCERMIWALADAMMADCSILHVRLLEDESEETVVDALEAMRKDYERWFSTGQV